MRLEEDDWRELLRYAIEKDRKIRLDPEDVEEIINDIMEELNQLGAIR